MPKNFNTTDLSPETALGRHIFHRDIFAHYLRWSHIVKEARIGDRIVDFGCGSGGLLEVLYRNKITPGAYMGLDVRKQTIDRAREKYAKVTKFPIWFAADDLTDPETDLTSLVGDRVCSFEVAEHVGRHRVPVFLENFAKCGAEGAAYYLSTPNFDPKVGAAGNHTYNAGRLDEDGNEVGVEVHELEHSDLEQKIKDAGFTIERKFGTFASQRDYKPLMNEWQTSMYESLKQVYDSNLVANFMAPIMPAEVARNCMWVLSR